jgi:hypothetical protein
MFPSKFNRWRFLQKLFFSRRHTTGSLNLEVSVAESALAFGDGFVVCGPGGLAFTGAVAEVVGHDSTFDSFSQL